MDEEVEEQKGLLQSSSSYKKKKGGLKTMPFIIGKNTLLHKHLKYVCICVYIDIWDLGFQ